MTVSVFEAAKHACERSGWALTNLQLQKILYLAHMLHLGQGNGPLVGSTFEAWDYGPVLPDLYHKVKVYGSTHVKNIFHGEGALLDGSEKDCLNIAVDNLSSRSARWLVAVTHWEGGAWAKNYHSHVRGSYISNEQIQQEYSDRAAASSDKSDSTS